MNLSSKLLNCLAPHSNRHKMAHRILAYHTSMLHTSSQLRKIEYHPSTVQLENNTSPKPLVVLFGWLLAKSRHLERYGNIYRHHGADVVTVKLEVMEVVRPKLATQVASKVVDLLKSDKHKDKPIVIHGFSVGGYLYAEVLNSLVTDIGNAPVRERIKGQIFDSPVDLEGIPHGVSSAAVDNHMLRKTIKLMLDSYLYATHRYTTSIYNARSYLFHHNPIITPSLFLFSENDAVARPETVRRCASLWKDTMGMPVTTKCWKESKHVSHMYTYPDEYIKELIVFMERLGIFPLKHNVQQLKELL